MLAVFGLDRTIIMERNLESAKTTGRGCINHAHVLLTPAPLCRIKDILGLFFLISLFERNMDRETKKKLFPIFKVIYL